MTASWRSFIQSRLKHYSTRKDDKPRYQDCLDTIYAGKPLDETQKGFLRMMLAEQQERSKRYMQRKIKEVTK